jgi:hypothetical protein
MKRFHLFYVAVILTALAVSLVLWQVGSDAFAPGPLPPPGLAASIVLLGSLLSFGLWRWSGVQLWRVLSPGLLVAGTMILAAGAYQQWLVTPMQVERDRAEQNRVNNRQILSVATDRHACPGGEQVVVVPGSPQRGGEAGGLTLEVFLIPVDETHEAVRLASARQGQTLMPTPAMGQYRGLLERCFGNPDALEQFLAALERRALRAP